MIYVRAKGAARDQQEIALLAYLDRHGYQLHAVCSHPSAAARLVEVGAVDVAVVAYADSSDAELEQRVQEAGGRLEYCRPPRSAISCEAGRMVAEMFRRGATLEQLAHLLDARPEEIRSALLRAGVNPGLKNRGPS